VQLTGDLSGIKVGLVKEGFANCEPDVAGLVTNQALALTTVGASVNQVDVPLHAKGRQGRLLLITVQHAVYELLIYLCTIVIIFITVGSAIWNITASTGIYNVMMASRGKLTKTHPFNRMMSVSCRPHYIQAYYAQVNTIKYNLHRSI
jgi:Asp-tRNA(Asn)/Glu-tRNA(Gln) amidotransferase A subunit family amidase